MFEFIQAIPFSFAAVFPVLNPLGGAFIFLSLTRGLSKPSLRRLAIKVAINTFVLLVVVLLTGTWILRFFGITVPVVQIGGGLVVAYIGWTLLNRSTSSGDSEAKAMRDEKEGDEIAFFPLTMPITAGPGCIAVTLAIGAHEMSKPLALNVLAQLGAITGILLASATVFLCYRYADSLTHRLGKSGTQVITRLSAFINLCIGIQIMWKGIASLIQ